MQVQQYANDAYKFQSTPPARGATVIIPAVVDAVFISIHAPREGGDQYANDAYKTAGLFQSTPPARGGDRDPVPTR